MTSLLVASSPVTYVDAIEATSMPGSSWFWRGGIELFAGAQNQPYLDRVKRFKVRGGQCAGGYFLFRPYVYLFEYFNRLAIWTKGLMFRTPSAY
jgi:hypothetical protein